jgi:ADP-heptose:LPS heptosyltransferase
MADLLALSRGAALCVSGDTGPAHLAAAVGTPVVGIFGPTDPERNGPWMPDDVVLSRYSTCRCHYKRRCQIAEWCLADVTVAEVTAAIQRRLGPVAQRSGGDV